MVSDSSLAANRAAGNGGGIDNEGDLTVDGSTLSGDISAAGGGIFNAAGATADVSDCDLTGNSAAAFGGGIDNEGELTVRRQHPRR